MAADRVPRALAWITSHAQRWHEWYIDQRFGAIDDDAPLGRRGEQVAARLLRRKGLQVIAESESDRAGEIDLIAIRKRPRLMVFVEVKTLSTTRPGHPADRVDENKQARITRAALRYLKRQKLLGVACRFDVVAVWWPGDEPRPTRIEHYESAFDAAGIDSFFV
ncbi:YraN family protein [Rhodopirellula sp. P2]|uniref:YraN family protein n=1 Tax=Rhodopirellula sp. P2 TaxID=2127060 RepID=UPI002367C54A|nr:YraN family protein [Rhodopirellula sp. P2]WDQ17997.1 YraN family protein [Rhodopirellula sp. P2]